ncbi:methyltransferase [Sphingomonas sp. SUN039]|uniref:methyltransferase n=1 Tax=Sphingomonas sp. SUN039 TaxID=2937787 RepID=UPI0021649A1A|nr:methyltransferase [Sphingomonas sp. SUN039]UVO54133.1 methyltransferase [Sphingomonas sp. SUN039]
MATSLRSDIKVRWVGWRNAILASDKFRRWAAKFPLTRPVARVRARETFSLVAGFVYSQVLAACVEGGVLGLLAKGPTTADQVAADCELSPAAALRLLRAAASLRLAEDVGAGRYMLGRVGAAIHADPGIVAMIRHHSLLYADLADPLALLRREGGGGALSGFWPYAEGQGGGVSDYSALMAASQPMVAAQATDAYDFARHRRMLDVGGGQGAFVAAVGSVAPRLHRAVFDLPDVVARIADPAVEKHGGSFLTDSLPRGYDLITLVRILHDHDDDSMLRILRAAKSALDSGGRLLIVEPMAGLRGDEAMGDAYFGMYLLAMGSGRARTPQELRVALQNCGFSRTRMVATSLPLIAQIIAADA